VQAQSETYLSNLKRWLFITGKIVTSIQVGGLIFRTIPRRVSTIIGGDGDSTLQLVRALVLGVLKLIEYLY
jgi:hypothetical protein